jgi:hypothetical protein
MGKSPIVWKKGRGKLGFLDPLLGKWRAEADSEMGKVVCVRTFTRVLDGAYVQLTADWEFANGAYKEIALIGVGPDKQVNFWSFTSDKKQAQGYVADMTDIHPKAIGFEAQMPAGLARMVYWPDDEAGFHWVVESKTKKGWNRFTDHHYFEV